MYYNIIWDLDGTIFDTYPSIDLSFYHAVKRFNKTISIDEIDSLTKVSISHCIRYLSTTLCLNENDLSKAFEENYDNVKPEYQPVFPGVLETCKYIIGNGGKNIIVTHREKASSIDLLTAHSISSLFIGIISNDDGFPKKPDPTSFKEALLRYKILSAETLSIGDRDIDIEAGRASGLFTCLYTLDKKQHSADLQIKKMVELLTFLKDEKDSRIVKKEKEGA